MGWMVGANPESKIYDRRNLVSLPGVMRHVRAHAPRLQAGSRLRLIVILSALIPFPFILVQCSKAPSAEMLAANKHAAAATRRRAGPARGAGAARPLPRRVAGADGALPAPGAGRSDHAGKPE